MVVPDYCGGALKILFTRHLILGQHAAILAVPPFKLSADRNGNLGALAYEGSSRVEKCERTHLITAVAADSRSGTWRDGRKSGLDRSIFGLKIDLPQYNPARISARGAEKKTRYIQQRDACQKGARLAFRPRHDRTKLSPSSIKLMHILGRFESSTKARVARPAIEM